KYELDRWLYSAVSCKRYGRSLCFNTTDVQIRKAL
ncbi:uncharacterized protein METZ01_LOCUS373042, partial [marine metagenome]